MGLLAYRNCNNQAGLTLIEMIMAMVIIAVVLSGLWSMSHIIMQRSATPFIGYQSVAIARAYMEEILSTAYQDPDGFELNEQRAAYDDVSDYNRLPDHQVRDMRGDLVEGFAQYRVTVKVNEQALLDIPAKKVTVMVQHADHEVITLEGFKVSY